MSRTVGRLAGGPGHLRVGRHCRYRVGRTPHPSRSPELPRTARDRRARRVRGQRDRPRIRLRAGRRLDSSALLADGAHARTDGYVSLGVVASAAVVAIGLLRADPIIGLLITAVILRVTWQAWRTVHGSNGTTITRHNGTWHLTDARQPSAWRGRLATVETRAKAQFKFGRHPNHRERLWADLGLNSSEHWTGRSLLARVNDKESTSPLSTSSLMGPSRYFRP